MQSSLQSKPSDKLHVAIIMDGNGRWATGRGLPRPAGHRAGVAALRRVVEAAPDLGVGTLTVYAFSVDNWRRPEPEVCLLMELLRHYLETETARLAESGTRLMVIGRRDRLPDGIASAIAKAEDATAGGTGLHLRIAIDYSARDAILAAAMATAATAVAAGCANDLTREDFTRLLTGQEPHGDVDLLIRTSGEKRLSDFLLWECAYAELHFVDRLWPDFGGEDLRSALADFLHRERRFGGLPSTSVVAAAPEGNCETWSTTMAQQPSPSVSSCAR